MGLDLTTYTMIVEELSRGWISISGVVNTHFIGSYLLMKFGTDEQKERLLPRMATGEIRAAFSLSEPELGSDVQAIKTSATTKTADGDYEINGQKMWVTNGLMSGVVFVLVKTDRDARPALQGHDLLHLREGARRLREPGPHRPAEDQEDGLQGRRVHRARLRRLPLPGRHGPRRRGGRPRPGLHADDGRARGRAASTSPPAASASPSARSSSASSTRRSAARSASRSPSTRRSSSSSPTWPRRSRPPGCSRSRPRG